jgi:hypothetical protein
MTIGIGIWRNEKCNNNSDEVVGSLLPRLNVFISRRKDRESRSVMA